MWNCRIAGISRTGNVVLTKEFAVQFRKFSAKLDGITESISVIAIEKQWFGDQPVTYITSTVFNSNFILHRIGRIIGI